MSKLSLEDVNTVVAAVDERMSFFTEIGTPIIDYYSEDLDKLMNNINNFVKFSKPEHMNINELQFYFTQLTSTLYFTTTSVEKVGLLMDLSNMSYKDAFNTSLLENSSKDAKLTVAKLNALADQESLAENVLNFIYSRTYKILRAKIDSANEMIRTLSKLISYRMQTTQTNEDRFDVNTKRLLLEDR